jgi:hypothetical protein
MVAAKLHTRDLSKSMRGPVKEFLKIDPSPLFETAFRVPIPIIAVKSMEGF